MLGKVLRGQFFKSLHERSTGLIHRHCRRTFLCEVFNYPELQQEPCPDVAMPKRVFKENERVRQLCANKRYSYRMNGVDKSLIAQLRRCVQAKRDEVVP